MNNGDLFDISGKVAIITGGAVGLGEQMAAALAEAGANLVLAARKVERCITTAANLEKRFGIKALPIRCDVGNPEEIHGMVEAAMAEFGQINILVNNAGTTWGGPAVSYPLKSWDKVMDVNLRGTFLCCQQVGRIMMNQGGGKIINIASSGGLKGHEPEKSDVVAYTTSKAGVIALTKDLAAKWARYNINVNAIAPGWFPTNMTSWSMENTGDVILSGIPMRRYGQDHELKGSVLYLASEASSYVTGAVLVVDGGEAIV